MRLYACKSIKHFSESALLLLKLQVYVDLEGANDFNRNALTYNWIQRAPVVVIEDQGCSEFIDIVPSYLEEPTGCGGEHCGVVATGVVGGFNDGSTSS